MGEDFPLDPAQVQHPQEGDQIHVDVNQSQDDLVPDSFVRDQEKAEVMAHAENDAFDRGDYHPPNASLKAGIDHDMSIAKARAPGYDPNKEVKNESDRKLESYGIDKRNQIARYSNAIVEHYRKSGDKPTASLAALAAVNELVQHTGYTEFDTGSNEYGSADVRISLDQYERVIVEYGDEQIDKAEKFTLSMLNGSSYEVKEEVVHDNENFDQVITTKKRYLISEDVNRLKEILAPAIAHRAEIYESEAKAQADWDEQQSEEDHKDAYDEYEDDIVSPAQVLARARAHFGNGPGGHEMAEEAARLYPGDFM